MFRTVYPEDLAPGSGSGVIFSPPPAAETLRTVWLDLHVSERGYQNCRNDILRPFLQGKGFRYVRIRPGRAIRVFTAEDVGVDQNHVAIITNVASQARHGLILATGKVDPGFRGNPLLLVVYNQSNLAVDLKVGAKIASVAFARCDREARATASGGHGLPAPLPDYAPSRLTSFKAWWAEQVYPNLGSTLLRLVSTLIAGLIGALIAFAISGSS